MARFVHPHFQQSRDLLRGSYDYATSHHVDFTGKAAAAIEHEVERHARRRAAEANTAGKKAAAE
jgi:negative regulator of sigma E activity